MSSHGEPKVRREFPGQHDDETVKFIFRQHPLVMRKQLIFGLCAITLAVLPFDFVTVHETPWMMWLFGKILIIVPLVVAVWWFHRWVGWYYSVYILTNRRIVVIHQKGFFDRSVDEWQLDKIYNVNYHINGLQAVMFGFGEITAQTIMGDFVMPTIYHPTDVHRRILEAVREAGGGNVPVIDKPRQVR
ncbi:MAG TPA: PH domain-containing protein [Candidatus Saccharimonas sp.]|nr:PH domain-containing protein [Candidatus Saccharimonas sp.]